jgi:dethiobiotin synthetase
MKRYFVTAIGTDIGKTFVTCALTWQLRKQAKRVTALKPIASGVASGKDDSSLQASDAGQLLAAQERPITDINTICPWQFIAPVSPDIAAIRENKPINFDDVIAFCNAPTEADIQLIEGVGGVMSPITSQKNVLDWMEELAIPVILLTAINALQSRNINLHCVIINESEGSAATLNETVDSLKSQLKQKISLHMLHRLEYKPDLWKTAASITDEWI